MVAIGKQLFCLKYGGGKGGRKCLSIVSTQDGIDLPMKI